MQNEDDFVIKPFCGTYELQRQIEEIMRQAKAAVCCALIVLVILIATVTIYLICRHLMKKKKETKNRTEA